jgi:hypothetical protein
MKVMAKQIKKSAKRIGKKVAAPKGKSTAGKNAKKASLKAAKVVAPKKAKRATVKKVKTLTKKTKKTPVKAFKRVSKTVSKKKGAPVLVKAVKTRIKSKAKIVAPKKVIALEIDKISIGPRKISVVAEKPAEVNSKVKAAPETRIPEEDLHFIPDLKERPPITTFEIHSAETQFHHREEVSFHQENKKVKNAMPSQKKFRSYNRSKGR